MRVHALWLVLAAGCGSVSDTPRDAPPADVAHDTSNSDAAVDGPPVLPAFGAPVLIQELMSPDNDADPSMTADGTELYFQSNRAGGMGGTDIWMSARSGTTWSVPTLVPALNSTASDQHPEISGNGLSIYFASARAGTYDIYVSVRANRSAPWSAPSVVTELSTATALEQRFDTSANGLVGLLDSDRGGATGRDLYLTTRASPTGAWGVPVVIADLAAGGYENGSLSGDGLAIYCTANGALYEIRRPSLSAAFGAPVELLELDTTMFTETDPWISADEKTILFGSNRSGNFELYQATRP